MLKKYTLNRTVSCCLVSLFLMFSGTIHGQLTTLNYTQENAVQNFVVPTGIITMTITAAGGMGGGSGNDTYAAGYGAVISGKCTVTPGHKLSIAVGQQGFTSDQMNTGGGGGASFVYDSNTTTALVVAAGGGGEGYSSNAGGANGGNGGIIYASPYTPTSSPDGSGAVVSGGHGGNRGTNAAGPGPGSGGGGWTTNGDSVGGGSSLYSCSGGDDRAGHFAGGVGLTKFSDINAGGYGGGGGGGYSGGGGGGGYNGGGGGDNLSSSGGGGGGGGSYLSGTIVGTPIANNSANGYVQIIYYAFSVTTTITSEVTCHAGTTGNATANVSGGTPPYTYAWKNATSTVSTANPTGAILSAGTYTITVTDNASYTTTATAVITQPAAALADGTPTLVSEVLCRSGYGSASAATPTGGTSPYSYAWNSGATIATITNTVLTAGTYTVKVTDNQGCTANATGSVTLTQPATAVADGAPTVNSNIGCNGGYGSATAAAATGGTPPYNYAWNGGTTSTNTVNAILSAGTYTVTATDANGCSVSSSATVTITTPAVLVANASATNSVYCTGGTGTAQSVPTGGTSPYTYTWSTGATTSSISATQGTYTLTVEDTHTCTATASVTITLPPVVFNFTQENSIQNWNIPAGVTQVTITAAGAIGGNRTGNSGVGGSGTVVSGVCTVVPGDNISIAIGAAGSNSVSGDGGGGGGGTFVYDSNTTTLLVVGAGGGGSSENNNNGGLGGIDISGNTVTNGTGGNASGGTSGTGGGSGSNNAGYGGGGGGWLGNGSNETGVTPAYGGFDQANHFTGGLAQTWASDANAGGYGGGGGGGYYGGGGGGGYNGGGGGNATGNGGGGGGGGSYLVGTVVGTPIANNNAGGYASISYTYFTLSVSTSIISNVTCGGGNNGSAKAIPEGGLSPYTYLWSNSSSSSTISNLSAGTYTLTINDTKGCSATGSVTITQPASLLTDAAPTINGNINCYGGTTNGTAAAATGGVSPYTYQWNNGASSTNLTITGLTAGAYTVNVTDARGCTANSPVAIAFQPSAPLSQSAPVLNSDVMCYGGLGTVTAGNTSGGTPAYTYSWNGGSSTTNMNVNLSGGTYTLTVTDAKGCTASSPSTVTITQPASALNITILSMNNPSCYGTTGTATANAATGGTSPYIYSWFPIGGYALTATGLSAGSYTVTVTDNNSCSATASVTLTQPTQVGITIASETNVTCFGGNNGTATANAATGGTTPYTYKWSDASSQTNLTASGLSSGTYTVTVKDNNGCGNSATTVINQPGTPVFAAISAHANANCNGGTGTATAFGTNGTSPYTYSWNDANSTVVANLTAVAGTYTVTVTDTKGCSATTSVTITAPSALTDGTPTLNNNALCFGGTGSAKAATPAGGTSPYTYQWNGGTSSGNATNASLSAGTYTVNITDAHGCTCNSSGTVTITSPSVLADGTPTINSTILCYGGYGSATAAIPTGGTAPYTYAWNGGVTSTNATDAALTGGTYTVNITDENGCTANSSGTVTMTQPNAMQICVSQSFSYISGVQTWTVPTGVTQITAMAVGAAGASGSSAGGDGAIITGAVNVSAGSVLDIVTGGIGIQNSGMSYMGGGGGTFIWNSTSTTLYVAAGGGGGGGEFNGGGPGGTDLIGNTATNGLGNNNAAGGTGGNGGSGGNGNVSSNSGGGGGGAGWLSNGGNGTQTYSGHGGMDMSNGFAGGSSSYGAVGGYGGGGGSGYGGGGGGGYNGGGGGNFPAYFYGGGGGGSYLNGTVAVTPVANNTGNGSATIYYATALSVTQNVNCNGGTNGSITVPGIFGGVSPYTYLWAPSGGSGSTVSNLSAGTYTVTVTDANGCSTTASAAITQPASLLNITISSVTNVTCYGNSNGSITASSPTGGTSPYNTAWSPSGGNSLTTTATLNAGTYTITVTDNNGCTATASATVTQPTLLNANAAVTTNACYNTTNGSGQVTASGGTSPYTYLWSNSVTNSTVTVISAGTYTVSINDANGCQATTSLTITQPASALVANATLVTGATCFGSNNGSAQSAPSGGTLPYTYSWNTGATTSSVSALSAGIYTVTVEDGNACSASGSVAITAPSVLQIPATSVISQTFSYLASVQTWTVPTGVTQITATAVGAAGASGSSAGGDGATITGAVNVSAGSVLDIVTGGIGIQNSGMSYMGGGGGTFIWNSTSTTLYVAAGGGGGGGEYSNGGPGGTDLIGNTATNGLGNNNAAGGTGGNGGSGGNGNVSSNSGGGGGGAGWLSNGGNGTQTYSGHGGMDMSNGFTGGSSSYGAVGGYGGGGGSGYGGGGGGGYNGGGGGNFPAYFYGGGGGGSYLNGTVAATPVANNTGNGSATIQYSTGISVNQNVSCNGGGNGSITVSGVSGGVLPYTYLWSNNATSSSISGLTAGSYSVTISDANGCSGTASIMISQPVALTATASLVSNASSCSNSGSVTLTVGGGTSPYTYLWNDPLGQTNMTATGLSAGTYSVNITDNNNCNIGSNTVTITQARLLSATASVTTNVSCYDGSNGSASVSPSGGVSPYTYTWSDANTTMTASISNLSAGSYSVSVQDANGCSATASVSITMPTQFQYITAGTISNVSCNGSSTGHITVTGIGGNLPYTYSWNGAAGPVSTMQSPNTMAAGSYTVTVTDNCGVSHTATATVTQPAVMQDSVSAQTNTSCGGGNGGSATIGASGGTYPYQYLWSNGASQATASALSAGSYSVVITDQHGCTNSVTGITITQPNPLTLNLSTISYPLCHAETTGAASVTEIGGTAPYTYTWSPAASTTNTAMNIAAGSYTVSVKDAHRCTASLVVVITQPAAIHDSVVKALTVNVACKNGSIGSATIGVKYGTAPYTYVWGATTYYTSTVTGLSAGTYSVTIEDANGCQSTVASLTITQPAMVQLDSVSLLVNTACYGGDGGVVSIGTRGGVSPYTYGWSDGKTGYNITGLTAGTYSVIITDKAGCSNSISSITITQPSAPVSSTINTDCTGNDMATVTIGGSGGTPGYSYLWSNGKTTTSLNVANGTYTVKVSDSRGCSATNSVMVLCDAAVVLRGHVVSDSNIAGCCGDGTLTNINLYPNPSSGQFTIQLSGVSGQWSVEVYSVLGQKVYSQSTIHQAQTTINLSNQPNGIYLIRILDSIGTLVGEKKVVKTN